MSDAYDAYHRSFHRKMTPAKMRQDARDTVASTVAEAREKYPQKAYDPYSRWDDERRRYYGSWMRGVLISVVELHTPAQVGHFVMAMLEAENDPANDLLPEIRPARVSQSPDPVEVSGGAVEDHSGS